MRENEGVPINQPVKAGCDRQAAFLQPPAFQAGGRETIERNPFDRVTFPKLGKPLIRPIEPEEFERLLLACTPPGEMDQLADRAVARNRAILWLLYDTGIRLSELLGLKLVDFDRKQGLLIVKGKGLKERRVALGSNCLRHLLYYLERHRPGEEELAERGNAGEDHVVLSETRLPLTKNGLTMLFERISPHIFRQSFAICYLVLANDPFSLQELLGHEDMTTVKNYKHMHDETIQSQKRKYSPGDHLPLRMPGPWERRRRGFQAKNQGEGRGPQHQGKQSVASTNAVGGWKAVFKAVSESQFLNAYQKI